MKRVGIDMHVVDGIYQGSRSHVLEIFSRIVSICPEIQFFLFLEKTEVLKTWSSAFSLPNVKLVKMPHSNPLKRLSYVLPSMQRKYKLDLLHTQYISPFPSYCKTIITLHDVLFESHPEYFSKLFTLRSKILMRLSAGRSAHVFTVSEYSKKEIIDRYGVTQENISVILNGVDQSKFYAGDDARDPVISRGLIPREYILTVGRLEPRKNHELLIRAYAKLNTKQPLVLVGQKHFGYQHIDKLIEELGLRKRVLIFEDINDDELPSFYRHANAFVYPTWAEGFGMPIIEAMASGIPVIASNTTSIPEVVGDAGILIDPANLDELVNAMDSILMNREYANQLAKRGLEKYSVYDWNYSASVVRCVYQKILGIV